MNASIRGLRSRLLGVVFVAVVAPCLALPAMADAGTYTVWSCRGPDGSPIGTSAWTATNASAPAGGTSNADTCASGGSFTVALTPSFSFPTGGASIGRFAPPAGTQIAGFTVWRSHAVAPIAGARRFTAMVRQEFPDGTFTDTGCTSGAACPVTNPSVPLDPSNQVSFPAAVSAVSLIARCSVSACPLTSGTSAEIRLFRSEMHLEDAAAPTVQDPAGSLTSGEPLSGTGVLSVSSGDVGGGVQSIDLTVDGASTGVSSLSGAGPFCAEPYSVGQPCPTAASRTFSVDTSQLADGAHTASGTVTDVAGNVTAFGPIAFLVQHPVIAPPVELPPDLTIPTNGLPAVQRPEVSLAQATYERNSERSVKITGTLRTAAGEPIDGAGLRVFATSRGVAVPTTVTLPAIVTANGTFTATVPKGDGSWLIIVSYAPRPDWPATAIGSSVVTTRTKISVHRSRLQLKNGQSVTLSGEADGFGLSAKNTPVEMQAIVRGRWTTVAVVLARASGEYRWTYQFRRIKVPTVFSFRTLVRSGPSWPWPSLHSKTVKVRVTPR